MIIDQLRALRVKLRNEKRAIEVFLFPHVKAVLVFYLSLFPESVFGLKLLVRYMNSYRKTFKEPLKEWKEFIFYAERLFQLDPEAILELRISFYFAHLIHRDFDGMKKAMSLFLAVQKAEAEKRNLDSLKIGISSTNMFDSYNVHAYLDTHVKATLLGLQPDRKIKHFLRKGDVVANPVMLEYWKQYIDIVTIEDEINKLAPLKKYLEEDLSFTAVVKDEPVYIEYAKSMVQKEWENANRPPLMKIRPEDFEFGWNILQQVGIKRGSWFVSLHVRDAGYKNGSHLAQDEFDSYRNSDIDTYHLAIKAIQARGGHVIRVGDPKMKQMQPITGVFDYAHSEFRSNQMDVFLFSQCRFFVGVSSGPILNPILFGVPTIMTNFMPVIGRPHASNCLYIPKLLWLNEKKRYASFHEILSSELGRIFTTHGYTERNVRIVDNTAEELEDVVEEMMDVLESKNTYATYDEELQEKLSVLYRQYSGYGDLGRVGRAFIKKYSEQGLL